MRRAAAAAFAFAALAMPVGPACAGSFNVRDGAGHWNFGDDPEDRPGSFVLRHYVDDTQLDLHFGKGGNAAFMLPAGGESPSSIRVDATRRIWLASTGLAGTQPQPIIARFLADGSADVHWGVQGRVQLSPGGLAVRPNDLLPLSDGSVLVAGETSAGTTTHAVVFHLQPDGSLDRAFGNAGVWQRAGDDGAVATSLAASLDGQVAVAVAVRGATPQSEIWSVTDAPALVGHQPLDPDADGEDLRVDRVGDQWAFSMGGGMTDIVPPVSLKPGTPASVAQVAASDAGAAGFAPFEDDAGSAPAAASEGEGLPWPAIGGVLAAIAAIVVAMAVRRWRLATVLRKPPGH
jgi:hypothetical protein